MGYVALIGMTLMLSLFANGYQWVAKRQLIKENDELKEKLARFEKQQSRMK